MNYYNNQRNESIGIRLRSKKNRVFDHAILIQDFFHKNALEDLRFGKLIDRVYMEGTVSHILNLGFSFCFM